MSIHNKSVRGLGLGVVLLFGAVATSWANGAPVGRSAAAAPLEGTWEVSITPYNCQTGVPVTSATFPARLSFQAGGTMTETNSNPSFQAGQRSAGLGYWERTGPASYHTVFQAYIHFTSTVVPPAVAPRYTRGQQRVEQTLDLLDENHWSSSALVRFEDAAGAFLSEGCFNATAERLQ